MSEKVKNLEEKVDKVDEKLEKISERLNSIDITLAKQEINLELHMARSRTNEIAVDELKNQITPVLIKFNFTAKVIATILTSGLIWKIVERLVL